MHACAAHSCVNDRRLAAAVRALEEASGELVTARRIDEACAEVQRSIDEPFALALGGS